MHFSGDFLVIVEIKITRNSQYVVNFFVVFAEANNFSDLRGCVYGIDRSGSRLCGWCKLVSFVERIKI